MLNAFFRLGRAVQSRLLTERAAGMMPPNEYSSNVMGGPQNGSGIVLASMPTYRGTNGKMPPSLTGFVRRVIVSKAGEPFLVRRGGRWPGLWRLPAGSLVSSRGFGGRSRGSSRGGEFA